MDQTSNVPTCRQIISLLDCWSHLLCNISPRLHLGIFTHSSIVISYEHHTKWRWRQHCMFCHGRCEDIHNILWYFATKLLVGFHWVAIVFSTWHIFFIVHIKLYTIFILKSPSLLCCNVEFNFAILHLTLVCGSHTCHIHTMLSLHQIPNQFPKEGCKI